MQAFGAVADALRAVGGFPAGLVLHSWAGHAEVTRQLAALPGVHFSLSGHTLRLAPRKLAPMLAQVRVGLWVNVRVSLLVVGAHAAPGAAQAGAHARTHFVPFGEALQIRRKFAAALFVSRYLMLLLFPPWHTPEYVSALRVQVPLDGLLLETDAPDGLPRLSGVEAADLVPVPEPPSTDGSCTEQRAGADASLGRSQSTHVRQEGGGTGASGAARDAAGGHCSDERQAGTSARKEADQLSGEGGAAGGSAAARERGSAERRGASTGADEQEVHGEIRTGKAKSGHTRPQLNHPANIRCIARVLRCLCCMTFSDYLQASALICKMVDVGRVDCTHILLNCSMSVLGTHRCSVHE